MSFLKSEQKNKYKILLPPSIFALFFMLHKQHPTEFLSRAWKTNKLFCFLGVLFPASSLTGKVADSVDLGQLALYGLHYVHVVWDVDVADVPAGDKQILQPAELTPSVPVQHILQSYVHEGVHVDHAAPRCALVPQVHRGHLTLQALQQDHHTVLCNCALPDGVDDFNWTRSRRRGFIFLWLHDVWWRGRRRSGRTCRPGRVSNCNTVSSKNVNYQKII